MSSVSDPPIFFFFFFNDTATTEIYTLSLHDALPICLHVDQGRPAGHARPAHRRLLAPAAQVVHDRSEEHTSELQSPDHLVCRLLLEKKKQLHTLSANSLASHQSIQPTHSRASDQIIP